MQRREKQAPASQALRSMLQSEPIRPHAQPIRQHRQGPARTAQPCKRRFAMALRPVRWWPACWRPPQRVQSRARSPCGKTTPGGWLLAFRCQRLSGRLRQQPVSEQRRPQGLAPQVAPGWKPPAACQPVQQSTACRGLSRRAVPPAAWETLVPGAGGVLTCRPEPVVLGCACGACPLPHVGRAIHCAAQHLHTTCWLG